MGKNRTSMQLISVIYTTKPFGIIVEKWITTATHQTSNLNNYLNQPIVDFVAVVINTKYTSTRNVEKVAFSARTKSPANAESDTMYKNKIFT